MKSLAASDAPPASGIPYRLSRPIGLQVTLIGLNGRPRMASSARLDGRFESEGRSHAFNSRIDRDGGGLLGPPTVRRRADSDRVPWRTRASDLSFVELGADGQLAHAGELRAGDRFGR